MDVYFEIISRTRQNVNKSTVLTSAAHILKLE